MLQVLFYIPLHSVSASLPDIPVYGYGMMLFLAYVLCSWLAGRLATREGIDRKVFSDLAIVLFVSGIIGARATFVIQEWPSFANDWWRIFYLWDGGLVLYGSIIGGAIGYFLAHRYYLAARKINAWKMADVIAPCIALGVALGRVGCLLTGCCYGNVACSGAPAIHFPLPSASTEHMARLGYQTLAGFTVYSDDLAVHEVEPGSPAADAGLRPGDMIVEVNGRDVRAERVEKTRDGKELMVSRYEQLSAALLGWPPGMHKLTLTVLRNGSPVNLTFLPESLGLHPTQIYETISMVLLVFLLLSYYPFKKRDGSVIVLLMVCYGVHRFLNEMLRIDNRPQFDGLTFSQNVSILVLIAAAVLAYFVFRRRPAAPIAAPAPAEVW
jgi:phosphatidylglycerol:prolipoprotein diacylglycerol transferase